MAERFTSPKGIRDILAGRNLAPRKSLGQNFLVDANIQQKIIGAANIHRSDLILEIGPGLGALTASLQERAGQVIAVEYDKGLYQILVENFSNKTNIKLLNQDFLETDLASLLDVYREEEYHYKVVANLPYYITTPVIFKLLQAGIDWETMIFLVQKEVADRICAGPGNKDYGALTVMIQFHGKPEKIMNVPKTVFYPAPQVDSTVIRITAALLPAADKIRRLQISPYLHRVVQVAFNQRRKTILNALGTLEPYFGSKEERGRILDKLGIDPQQRGETLTLDKFLGIATEMYLQDFKPELFIK
jgi:16S rRNA (adenine1518-N6/adenine1519-N6)-dimethyltransferase